MASLYEVLHRVLLPLWPGFAALGTGRWRCVIIVQGLQEQLIEGRVERGWSRWERRSAALLLGVDGVEGVLGRGAQGQQEHVRAKLHRLGQGWCDGALESCRVSHHWWSEYSG